MSTPAPAFKSLLEVCDHLKKAGFKISKSRLYRDRDKGLISVNQDGTVPEAEVRAYAATYLEQKGASVEDLSNIQADKADLEREKLREQIEKLRFSRQREQGLFIRREEVDLKMVGVLMVLDVNFRQLLDLVMVDICHLVGGDLRKINNAKEFIEKKMDEMMNQLAHTDSFSLNFKENASEKDSTAEFKAAVEAELEARIEEIEEMSE